jgi:hypothetical protein
MAAAWIFVAGTPARTRGQRFGRPKSSNFINTSFNKWHFREPGNLAGHTGVCTRPHHSTGSSDRDIGT